jgi:septal ring factor EnvC (AmiA/AmiB activator)
MKAADARRQALEAEAKAVAAEVAALQKETVTLAATIREKEESLSALEDKIAQLTAQQDTARTTLEDRLAHMSNGLAALQRLAHRPPVAMIASPQSPDETVESALLLRAVVPALEQKAQGLSGEIAKLAALSGQVKADEADERMRLASLGDDKAKVDALIKKRSAAESRLDAEVRREAQKAQALGAKAKDLESLLKTLEEAQRQEAERQALVPGLRDGRPFSAARGMLPLPVVGTVVERYGDDDTGGIRSRGITLLTRDHAQVVAPYDGRIVFAGPFRGYGLLLIIDHGEGYHSLLSGMMRIDGVVGEDVLAGEPVGEMGGSGAGGAGNGKPLLYVELRHDGNPIDPMPWLALSDRKVNG